MLNDAEKAVLFLLSLEEEVARPIVDELGEDELKRLRLAATRMREVPKDAVDTTFKEFLERSDAAVAVPRGGIHYLRRLSAGALGEERARLLFEEEVEIKPISRLEAAAADDVAGLLMHEPPQIAAAVLSMMSAARAAEILAAMGEAEQAAIVKHVSKMKELPASVLDDVVAALASQLPDDEGGDNLAVDGVARAAELLNATGKAASTTILSKIEEEDPDLANTVRQAMFTFDDLGRLDVRAMRTLLREVATDRLTLALRGAPEAVLTAVFSGLSQRAADLIRDDLENMGHVRKADVEAARREVIEVALQLEGEGRLSLGREEE